MIIGRKMFLRNEIDVSAFVFCSVSKKYFLRSVKSLIS